jgi:hypothetical protein
VRNLTACVQIGHRVFRPVRDTGMTLRTFQQHVTIMGVRWWLLLAVPAIWFGHSSLPRLAAIYAGFVAIAYVLSLILHPHRRCRNCNGTGREPGAMFTWGDRPCTRCGGGPRHRRWGVQVMSREKPVWAERSAVRARERAGRPR